MKNHRTVYLDYAATTPMDRDVLDAMLPWLRDGYGNPSSVHGLGRRARGAIEQSRERIAELLGATVSEIVFTSGGTEANNLAIAGSIAPGRTIVTSRAEHEAVLRPVERLQAEGSHVGFVPLRPDGTVAPKQLASVLGKPDCHKAFVSLMHVNNETGATNDLKELTRVAHEMGATIHTDAVQAIGLLDTRLDQVNVDLLSISGHKLYGPKGVGVLYIRSGREVEAQLLGGAQERRRRAGTENVAAIVGMAMALEKAVARREALRHQMGDLRDRMLRALNEVLAGDIVLNSPIAPGRYAPHIINVSITSEPDAAVDGEMVLLGLDLEGICASSGSACTSGTLKPSHVLEAMGRSRQEASAAVRFSLGAPTTSDDVDFAVERLATVVRRMKESSASRDTSG